MNRTVGCLLLCGLLSACVIIGGDDTDVSISTEPNISQCLPRGTVHVSYSPDPVDSQVEIESELLGMALERALPFGGDTVVPAGPLQSGGQFFNVYRCRDLQRTEPPVIGIELEKPV